MPLADCQKCRSVCCNEALPDGHPRGEARLPWGAVWSVGVLCCQEGDSSSFKNLPCLRALSCPACYIMGENNSQKPQRTVSAGASHLWSQEAVLPSAWKAQGSECIMCFPDVLQISEGPSWHCLEQSASVCKVTGVSESGPLAPYAVKGLVFPQCELAPPEPGEPSWVSGVRGKQA